ncbi:MAG TPA: hypothetical protein VGJ13_18060 [Pseudonocardiaceae bacterium]
MNHDDDARDTDGQSGAAAGRQELLDLRARMGVIKQEVTADVEEKWATPWRTPAVFDLKVTTRLSGHAEYRSLRVRISEIETTLAALAAIR